VSEVHLLADGSDKRVLCLISHLGGVPCDGELLRLNRVTNAGELKWFFWLCETQDSWLSGQSFLRKEQSFGKGRDSQVGNQCIWQTVLSNLFQINTCSYQ